MRHLGFFLILLSILFASSPTDTNELKLRIKILQRDIKNLEKQKNSISAFLERSGIEIEIIKAKILVEEGNLKKLEEEIKRTSVNLEDINKKLAITKREILRISSILYRGNLTGLQKILLFIKSSSSVDRLSYLIYLAQKHSTAIQKYSQLLREKNRIEKELRLKIREKKRLLRKLKRRERSLKRKQLVLMKKLKEIERDREKKKKLLKELSSVKIISPPVRSETRETTSLQKGHLSWPLSGKVVRKFGLQIHPVFKTKIKSNGIEISPSKEEYEVRAVADGKVAFISRFRGYGRVIILDHGGRYYTIYGHLLDIYVKRGERVKKGQVMGSLGKSSFWKGRTLYFEIRYGDQPLNPLRWLSRR